MALVELPAVETTRIGYATVLPRVRRLSAANAARLANLDASLRGEGTTLASGRKIRTAADALTWLVEQLPEPEE